ncbi:MAG: TonB-dependent siderophore receptor, partial [Methyloglobulus sp.]|nr:TonB-dependent siderophore receptor [Methyloglobulus sp.]
RFVDAATVTIEPSSNFRKTATAPENPEPQSSSGEGQIMPKVTVEADSAYDPEYYADPYNKDYVIPNATAGTKTDTPIMETPLNVQVISKQVLKDQQAIRLDQALKNISGVTTTTASRSFGVFGGSSQAIFLRGFESETFFRNGFRLQQGSASRELANVESVEVLKGPAAILYGLVEPGGMVNVVTKQPLATPYYGFSQQFGSYDLYRTTIDATGPITKNKELLYRVNMSYENSGSFRDFVGKEDVFLAPVLKWNISPKTQVTFEMEYNHQHQGLDPGFIPLFNGKLFNMPRSRNYAGYSPATTETIFGGFNWSHQFNDDWTIKHRFSVNQQTFTAPFGFRPEIAGDKTFVQNNVFGAGQIPDSLGEVVGRTFSAGIVQNTTTSTNLDLVGHFNTASLKHTLLLGGDFYQLDREGTDIARINPPLYSFISLNNPVHPGTKFPPPDFIGESPSSSQNQYGLYLQDQIKLPYDVHVMGGIRYQYIHQNDKATGDLQTQDAVTPRVGILWQPKGWLSLYANYAESFGANTGRTFITSTTFGSIAPTSATQYEGGIKAEFFDGKLRANLAYYDLTKTNVTVGDPRHGPTDCAGGPCSIALGEIRSRGPELDITGEILPGWNVITTWANTDIIVTKAPVGGAVGVGTGLNPVGSFSPGSRVPNVPRNTGRFWSTYEVQGGDFKGVTFGGGVTLRDSQVVANLGEQKTSKIPGYATFDLMAGYSRNVGDAKISLQLNVNNLLDKDYISSLFKAQVINSAYADFGQPRTFMGSINIQY